MPTPPNRCNAAADTVRRVLFVVHGFPPRAVGGVELHASWLASELQARGIEVFVLARDGNRYTPSGTITDGAQDGIFIRWLVKHGGDSELDPFVDDVFEDLLMRVQPDIVHIQHLIALSTGIPYVVARWGIPLIVSIHDYWYGCHRIQLRRPDGSRCDGPEHGDACARYCAGHDRSARVRYLQSMGILRLADRLLVPSNTVRDRYVSWGVDPEKVMVLPLGMTQPKPGRVRARRNGDSPLVIGFLGTVHPQKGVDTLVRAVQRFDSGEVSLRVFGQLSHPTYAAYVRRLAGGRDQVTLAGRYDQQDLDDILAEVDVVAVPSRWPETFNFVAREALLRGIPVLASADGALQELADTSGVTLLPADNVDAWASAIAELIHNGHRRLVSDTKPIEFQALTHSEYGETLLGIYTDVLQRRDPSRNSSVVPSLSVGIVTYNSESVIRDCLMSMYSTTNCQLSVIVVDNASRDGTRNIVGDLFPWVTMICNERNEGYTRAINQFIAEARSTYVLFLNPDVRLYPGVIDSLIQRLESSRRLGAVAPRLILPNGDYQLAGARLFRPFDLFRIYGFTGVLERRLRTNANPYSHAIPETALDDGLQPVDYVIGACLLTRRDVLDEVGTMDESTFMYGDDIDWCTRVREAGYEVAVDTTVTAFHVGGSTHALHDRYLWTLRGYAFLLRKYYGRLGNAVAFVLSVNGRLRRMFERQVIAASLPAGALWYLLGGTVLTIMLPLELGLSLVLAKRHQALRRRMWLSSITREKQAFTAGATLRGH